MPAVLSGSMPPPVGLAMATRGIGTWAVLKSITLSTLAESTTTPTTLSESMVVMEAGEGKLHEPQGSISISHSSVPR